MASPAIPGLFFCFAACVLLVFACVSSPTWEKISFLNVRFAEGNVLRFGVFGFTGSGTHVGYRFPAELLGFEDTRLSSGVIHNLTYVLILHPIAAGLAGLSVLFGLCGAAYSRVGTIFMSLSAALATLVTLVVWVVDMVLWGIARNRINDHGPAGTRATYGNANWLVLGAFVALLLGFCAGAVGSCGRYRRTPAKV
ncbi:pali-domain-containing protein [Auricularia subglabra TFB-10046 SS5]|uniref:Pali-domain-containing protein n=1 Tax=Auricularia subglabra (strain TFB-10046 / SS5) TaxID=717982 RepID=J0WX13_AURST|nr:pali-domain-containing protein [Auricularia subglabra TFB-10046 SS5]